MGPLFNEAIPVAIVLATMSKALSQSVVLLLSSMAVKAASVLRIKWVIASVSIVRVVTVVEVSKYIY